MAKKKKTTRKNPPMKRIKRSTGWMPATAVKIVKGKNGTRVLVRKRGRK
jgi:hypothetical protein